MTDPGAAVVAAAELVFGVVEALRREALQRITEETADDDRGAATPWRAVLTDLRPVIRSMLSSADPLVGGLGLIAAPGLLGRGQLGLEWWQRVPESVEPEALLVDLNSLSSAYYDYESAAWFDGPRRLRQRHIAGPYVDVHGTGWYVLTFTLPIVVDDQFLGVAGADVHIARLESRLLHELGAGVGAVVINDEGRVLLSTSVDPVVGDLVPDTEARQRAYVSLDGLPWRLRLDPGPNR